MNVELIRLLLVIWVPDENHCVAEYTGDEQPDLILKSLEEFVPEEWGFQPYGDKPHVNGF
jgi:pseudouridine 5'-phosphatase